MFPNKAEKILFYPVTILATIFALNAILSQQFIHATGLTAIAGLLWASPFIKDKMINKTVRVLFWLALAVVFFFSYTGILWILSDETQKLFGR